MLGDQDDFRFRDLTGYLAPAMYYYDLPLKVFPRGESPWDVF